MRGPRLFVVEEPPPLRSTDAPPDTVGKKSARACCTSACACAAFAAALARAQVLQQLTVLEGLVDANSRSREEWLEAQNELDYRMVRVRGLRARAS